MRSTTTATDRNLGASGSLPAVKRLLNSVARRLSFRRLFDESSIALIFSSITVILIRTVVSLAHLLVSPALSVCIILPLFLAPEILILTISLLRPVDLVRVARFVDLKFDLKERLSSALTLSELDVEPSFLGFVRNDAERAAVPIDPKSAVNMSWKWLHTAALASFLLALLLLFLPASALRTLAQLREIAVPSTTATQNAVGKQATVVRTTDSSAPHVGSTGSRRQTSTRMQHKPNTGAQSAASSGAEQEARRAALDAAAKALDQKPYTQARTKPGAPGTGTVSTHDEIPPTAQNSQRPSPQSPQQSQAKVVTLGDKLRAFGKRIASRPLTSGEFGQAAASLDDVNSKLDGYSMPRTQQDLTVSAQDLRDFQQTKAVGDIMTAAHDADTEGATAPAGQGTGGRPLTKNDVVIPAKGSGSGSGKTGGNGQQGSSTTSSNDLHGAENGKASGQSGGSGGSSKTSPDGKGSGSGAQYAGGGTQKPNFGPIRQIDPSKIGRIVAEPAMVLPVSNPGGRSSTMKGDNYDTAQTSQAGSTIPYVKLYNQYKMRAEKDASSEPIPPSYRETVRKYFTSLPVLKQ